MTSVGIIAGHPTKPKRFFWSRYTKKIILGERNPFQLTVVRVPFGEQELEEMSQRQLERILGRARRLLDTESNKNCVLSRGFEKAYDSAQIHLGEKSRRVLAATAYLCIRRLAGKCGIKLMDAKICIRSVYGDRIIESLMKKLCFDTKSIVLCIKDISKGQIISENFFDDTGMSVQVVEDFCDSRADVVVDVDKGEIKFDNILTVDGAEFDFELDGADVDCLKIAALIDGFEPSNKILSYLSGKKKLTL